MGAKSTGPVIEVRDLHVGFGAREVLKGLDLEVAPGQVLGFVGGSGQGKSVLTRTILGLIRKQSGSIKVFGEDLDRLSPSEHRALERRWGVMFQGGALFSALTVRQNIQAPMREHLRLSQAAMDELAFLKIRLVGLPADAAEKFPSELSGGMVKRAALARALALDPDMLFLDEPTAGLDPIGAAAFDQLILTLRDALGFTVFLITHDLDTIYTITDRVAVLAQKRVVIHGTLPQVEQFDDPWVQAYFHGPRGRAAAVAAVAAKPESSFTEKP